MSAEILEQSAAPDSAEDVLFWRVEQFSALGYPANEAWALAESCADLGQARTLRHSGCPLDLALRILL